MLTMMLRAASLALIVGLSAIAAAASDNNSTATCDPSTWSAGHDFKNMQYSHVPGTSAADW